MVRNMTLACLMAIIMVAVMACGSDQGIIVDNDELPISEEDALRIAMMDLDPEIYTATSTITGPMEWNTEPITAYEVTVNGGDHLILRYVDGQTGDLYPELDVTHEIPIASDLTDGSNASYYTSCQSGWPLCIYDPDSIYFYSQNDTNWKTDILNGGSGVSIGSGGCLLTSAAMALRYKGRGTRTPRTFNTDADSWNCFPSENDPNISLSCAVPKANGGTYTHDIGVSAVWNTLASNIPVIVFGYESTWKTCHAMMLWGHDGSRYWGKDPNYQWNEQDQPLHMLTDANAGSCTPSWRSIK